MGGFCRKTKRHTHTHTHTEREREREREKQRKYGTKTEEDVTNFFNQNLLLDRKQMVRNNYFSIRRRKGFVYRCVCVCVRVCNNICIHFSPLCVGVSSIIIFSSTVGLHSKMNCRLMSVDLTLLGVSVINF